MLPEVRGFEMQITVQQSPMSAKQFHSHQITPNLSLRVGGESKYPSESRSPVLVWLKTKALHAPPALASSSWLGGSKVKQAFLTHLATVTH